MQVDEEETYVETPPSLLEMVERSEERKAQPVMEETQPIHLGTADEPQEVRIGTTLTLEERISLIALLKEYNTRMSLHGPTMICLDSAQT